VISRIRSLVKKHVPEKSQVDLSVIAREVITLVNHEAQRQQVKLRSQLSDSLPIVMGDRVQLQQVLLNLLMNGIEAMSEVDAGKRELSVTTEPLKPECPLLYRTPGPASPSQTEQIFEHFIQPSRAEWDGPGH
jgi:C4-dicarboxylate-specific signal transduction histidine kinase